MKLLYLGITMLLLNILGCGDVAQETEEAETKNPTKPVKAKTLELDLPEFVVQPGEQVFKCIYIDLPVDRDYLLSGIDVRMPGGHHFGLWYTNPDAPFLDGIPRNEVVDCDEGLKTYITGSEWDEFELNYPKGMVSRIPKNSVLVLEAHYVNSSSEPLPGKSTLTLQENTATGELIELGYNLNAMKNFEVQPNQTVQFTARCPIEANLNLAFLTSHMHKMGQEFRISLVDDGTGKVTEMYENFSYENPSVVKLFDDPIVTKPGQSIEWLCTYENTTSSTLVGGPYGHEDVMCNMIALFWPATGSLPYCFSEPEVDIL